MCFLTDPQYSSGNSIISKVGDAFAGLDSSLGLSKTLTNIVEHPLPMLETLALNAVGVPPMVTNAIVSAANGGSLEQIATNMATAYVATNVGNTAGTAFSASDFAKNIDPTLAKVLTQTVTSASGNAAVAALQGKDLGTVLSSAANAAVSTYVGNTLAAQMGLKDPSQLDTKVTQNAIASATNAILKGKDIGSAITNSVTQTALTEGIRTGVDQLSKNSQTIQDLQKSFAESRAALTDYKTEIVDAAYNTVKDAYNSATSTRDQFATASSTYNDMYAKYSSAVDAANNYVQPMAPGYYTTVSYGGKRGDMDVWNPPVPTGPTKDEMIAQAKALEDPLQKQLDTVKVLQDKVAAADSTYTKAVDAFVPIKTEYDNKVQTLVDTNTQITDLNAKQTTLLQDVTDKTGQFEKVAATTADDLATKIGTKAVEDAKQTLADQQAAADKAAADAKAAQDAADAKAAQEAKDAADKQAALDKQAADAKTAKEQEDAKAAQDAHDAQLAKDAADKAAADKQAADDKAAADKAAADAKAIEDTKNWKPPVTTMGGEGSTTTAGVDTGTKTDAGTGGNPVVTVSGTPIYADSPEDRTTTVTPPTGYTLMPSKYNALGADLPTGAYYDTELNAWLMPATPPETTDGTGTGGTEASGTGTGGTETGGTETGGTEASGTETGGTEASGTGTGGTETGGGDRKSVV